eukprot:4033968-Pleurochrysis_carterae.AAC.1
MQIMFEAFQLYDDDSFVGDKKVDSTSGVFKEFDIVRCTDMGYLFEVYRLYKPMMGCKVYRRGGARPTKIMRLK